MTNPFTFPKSEGICPLFISLLCYDELILTIENIKKQSE